MKNTTILSLLLLISFSLFAGTAPKETKVKSVIKQVTVFRVGAQVTRTATASMTSGNNLLTFTGISPQLDKNSIQVKGEGNFTILSVNHQLNYFEAPAKSQRILDLEKERKRLTEKDKQVKALLSVLQEEESLLLTNKSIGGSQTGVRIEDLKATAAFYRTRLKAIKLEALSIQQSAISDRDSMARIAGQLKELNAEQGVYTSEIVVAVTSEQAASGQFTISYVVKNAGWFPNYDVRVQNVENPINLKYKGNVFQTSGEAWDQVKLTLSTGDFSKQGTKPNLLPWRLDFYNPYAARRYGRTPYASGGGGGSVQGFIRDEAGEALIGATVMVTNSTMGTVTDIDGFYRLSLPPNARSMTVSYTGYDSQEIPINGANIDVMMQSFGGMLDEVVVTGSGRNRRRKRSKRKNEAANTPIAQARTPEVKKTERATTVEFEIATPYTIPSNGKQYTVQVKDYELPAYYEYYCAPKLDPDAFLTAQVTGWEALNLLSGEANLFFEGTFLGKSILDVQVVEDTLDISLGRDKGIVVERKKQKDYSKKQFIGNKKTDYRSWDISIRNKKKQRINLILEDQFPLTTNSDIEVKQVSSGGADLNNDTGVLRWEMTLDKNETKQVNFKYSVKYPKKKSVVLD